MKPTPIFVASIVAAALGLGSAAHADDKSRRGAAMFEELDTDSNGEISQAELQARGAARFAEADGNGDGFLSAEEIAAAGQSNAARRAERMIEHLDANDDGQLSQDELRGRRDPGEMFARLDEDESGGISAEEFQKMRKGRGGWRHKR